MIGSTNQTPCVKGLSTLVRPQFGPGMLLEHDDLNLLADYTRELNRLLFRSLFGCGVICGLEVKYKTDCGKQAITIDPGVGLVCSGDPVYVPRQQTVVLEENCAEIPGPELWVVLCGKAKACSPRPSMCGSDDDEIGTTATRERTGFEICVVKERPKCACACEPPDEKDGKPVKDCYQDHRDGVCGCACEGGQGCCDCIVLARLIKQGEGEKASWTPDHAVRRFIRPVLLPDPLLAREAPAAEQPADKPAMKSAAARPESKRRK